MTTTANGLLTSDNLIRATGPFAIMAGLIFAGIQPVHPPDFVSSVDEVVATERQLLYVAATRARDRLFVSGVEPASELLEELARRA